MVERDKREHVRKHFSQNKYTTNTYDKFLVLHHMRTCLHVHITWSVRWIWVCLSIASTWFEAKKNFIRFHEICIHMKHVGRYRGSLLHYSKCIAAGRDHVQCTAHTFHIAHIIHTYTLYMKHEYKWMYTWASYMHAHSYLKRFFPSKFWK